jgi:hypothetical protein
MSDDKANRDTDDHEGRKPDQYADEVKPLIEKLPSRHHDEEPANQEQQQSKKWCSPEWAMVIVGAVGIFVALWTIGVLNDTLVATKQSVDAVRAQVRIMQDQLEAGQRPRMVVSKLTRGDIAPIASGKVREKLGEPAPFRTYSWQVENVGTGAAFGVQLHAFRTLTQGFSPPGRDPQLTFSPTDHVFIVDNHLVKPTGAISGDLYIPDDLDEVPDYTIHIYGWLTYCDSFGVGRSDPFYWFFLAMGGQGPLGGWAKLPPKALLDSMPKDEPCTNR